METNLAQQRLPETSVHSTRGNILVCSNTFSFDGIPGIEPHAIDDDTAVMVTMGPITLFLSAAEALKLADALEAHAHHFIALATEAHAAVAA